MSNQRRQTNQTNQRTQWAERHVEEFLALPLIAESVFRSPQTVDTSQKEIVDFLVINDGTGILISQKCQEDPSRRDSGKTGTWARKAAKRAVGQLRGALKSNAGRACWCVHPRRGRVDFGAGLPPISHGIVIVEVSQSVDLEPDANDLPLDVQGVPISYLSVNDFLNLANELRTVPELQAYLAARRGLPTRDQRIIGNDKVLFEAYLLNNGALASGMSHEQAAEISIAHQDTILQLMQTKRDLDRYSTLLEHVADQLATRHAEYAKDLSPELLAKFDPPEKRTTYLQMQEVLTNLRLNERAQLGRLFAGVIEEMSRESEGFTYAAAYLDSKLDWVFVFAASRGVTRAKVLVRLQALMAAAAAFYGKNHCMAIIDRDGLGYEVGFLHTTSAATEAELQAGADLFGRLRITDTPVELVPQASSAV